MGKVLMILIGLILILLGVWGVWNEGWRQDVINFVQGGLVIMAIVVGLVIFVFGLSELRAGAEEPPVVETPPPSDVSPGEGPSNSQ